MESEWRRKAAAIGLSQAPAEIARRHIEIIEHSPSAPVDPEYIPVHIMWKKGETMPWTLLASGTLIAHSGRHIVTAYHVFLGAPAQYGYRQIGRKEFGGAERVVPIVDLQVSDTKDTIVCIADPESSVFPELSVPKAPDRMIDLVNRTYPAGMYKHPPIIRLLTYPQDPPIHALAEFEYEGATYVLFRQKLVAAESGTGALIEGEKPDDLLVAIRSVQYTDKETLEALGVPQGEMLGLGMRVHIKRGHDVHTVALTPGKTGVL